MTHPTFERCRIVAQNAGSTAQTTRGVARFLRDSRQARRNMFGKSTESVVAWKAKQAQRKADPEAKRAIHDKAFRRRFLAKLNRREARAIACDGTIAAVMWYYTPPVETKRREELAECARLRSIVTGKKCEPVKEPSFGHQIEIQRGTALMHGVTLTTRGKDYTILSTKSPSCLVHVDGSTEWKNGRAVKYTRATNDNYVRSLAVIRDSQTLDYICHESRYTITLAPEFRWDVDRYGLRAVMCLWPANDFHPTAAEMMNQVDRPGSIENTIIVNRETRERYAAEHAAELAEVAGVYVCLADSIRAGNCQAGTLAFAQKHRLNPTAHYTAPELLAQANGDAGRVRIAITAARIRHDREEAAGFCLIADHSVNR